MRAAGSASATGSGEPEGWGSQVGSFLDAEGVRITTYEWPVDAPAALVQVSHGIGEHAGRYERLATDLNAAGFSVFADDHRGHGATGMEQWGDASRLGHLGPGGLRATIEAVHAYSVRLRKEHPGVPLVLLGHSWGSLMAQISLNRHAADYDGIVLSGTAYRMAGYMNPGDLNRRHRHLGTTGAEWLSRDPAVATAWVADPLTFPAKTAKLLGIRDGLRLWGRPARSLREDLPVLIQIGEDDSVGGRRSAERLVRAYRERSGIRDVTLHIYPGARHEIYNEINRDEVIGDLAAWLRTHVVERRSA
jgi:alpha-beta hydrolase superfamily lysophospholipase